MKRRVVFPPVESATEDGLVAIGGDLHVDTLLEAYRQGIFPWPVSVELPLAWFSPNPRGVLDFDEIHLSRSFQKFLKKNPFHVTFNQAFSEVIKQCARMVRKDQGSTWITPPIISGYERLFEAQLAYSVEVWREDLLVGGLYGVSMGNFFSGESMFMKETNASKLALFALIEQLKKRSIRWLDTQMVTPVVEQFGGKYISRPEFLARIAETDWTRDRYDFLDVT
jgi:leucyl/phenylalanyl-tRNA---protein transferase